MSIQQKIKEQLGLSSLEINNPDLENDINGINNNQKKGWFEEQYAYYNSLSDNQKEIIKSYTGYGAEMGLGEKNENELEKIILNAPTLKSRMIVWSGRTRKDSAKAQQRQKIYRNRRFISTSIVLHVADQFAFSALYKIILPINSKCLFIPITINQGIPEFEILLPKNAAFYIMDRKTISYNLTNFYTKKIQITTMHYLIF